MVSRKEFLLFLGRGLVVVGITLGLHRFISRGQITSPSDPRCIQPKDTQGICSLCSLGTSCIQPQAQSFRKGS